MNEIKFFLSQPAKTKILIGTSFLYAFVLPVIEIFTTSYILRNSTDSTRVIIYQLTVYTGIPITFLLNGYLLTKIRPSILYSFGMLLSGVSMLFITSLPELSNTCIGIAGLLMGVSFGFFWANRDYLTLISTSDQNRNYYYGVDTFVNTFTFVIVPVCVGWFIQSSQNSHILNSVNATYHMIMWGCLAMALAASYLIMKGNFENPRQTRFVFFKFDSIWRKMIMMSILKGMVQGFIVTVPTILVMKLIGEEGVLGTLQSTSALVTAILVYIVGRYAKPEHRLKILAISLVLFILGSMLNSLMFNAMSAMIFLVCLIIARPLFDLSYFPIQLKVIDHLSVKENRNKFAYILNHEFGLYAGRFVGCGLFIILAWLISDIVAIKYTLPIVTIFQTGIYFLAKIITKQLFVVNSNT